MPETRKEIKIIQIPFQRMVYELLDETSREWTGYLEQGYSKFVIDMSKVSFMDSASIGCLMDFYRKVTASGGRIHLAAVQPRIETLLAIAKAKGLFGMYTSIDEARRGFEE
jgi:anti-anti-sigma factor